VVFIFGDYNCLFLKRAFISYHIYVPLEPLCFLGQQSTVLGPGGLRLHILSLLVTVYDMVAQRAASLCLDSSDFGIEYPCLMCDFKSEFWIGWPRIIELYYYYYYYCLLFYMY